MQNKPKTEVINVDKTIPNLGLCCKLGSIIVHIQEALSKKGSGYDIQALIPLVNDKEVNDWLKEMDKMTLLPKKR